MERVTDKVKKGKELVGEGGKGVLEKWQENCSPTPGTVWSLK